MSTPPLQSSINNTYNMGVRMLVQEHADREVDKIGILRAGNAGLCIDGDLIGKCHRTTYLRLKGVTFEAPNYETELMFGLGRANEDLWIEVLSKSWTGIIKRESEIPIRWTTANGTLVTGRPDIVLCGLHDGQPIVGIELKQVCSFRTAKDVLLGKPKLEHFIQCAHYSLQVGVPFELWYTNRVNWPIDKMPSEEVNLPLQGEDGCQHLSYRDGTPTRINPYRRGFRMRWREEDGCMEYQPISVTEGKAECLGVDADWYRSIISEGAIRAYYDYIATMEERDSIGPLPRNQGIDGMSMYSMCGYCSLKPVCTKFKKEKKTSLKEWVQAVLSERSKEI